MVTRHSSLAGNGMKSANLHVLNAFCVFFFLQRIFQVVLLSATMPVDVLDVTNRFMRNPIRILVKKEELTLEGIRQFYINVQKDVRLHRVLRHGLAFKTSVSRSTSSTRSATSTKPSM